MSVKPIFFALDGKSLKEFKEQLDVLKDHIYGVKVGLELLLPKALHVLNNLRMMGGLFS